MTISDCEILYQILDNGMKMTVSYDLVNMEKSDTRRFTTNLNDYARIVGNRFKDDYL